MWDLIENIINNHMEYIWEHQIPRKNPSNGFPSAFSAKFGSDFWNWNLLRTGTIIELLVLICGTGIKISEKKKHIRANNSYFVW